MSETEATPENTGDTDSDADATNVDADDVAISWVGRAEYTVVHRPTGDTCKVDLNTGEVEFLQDTESGLQGPLSNLARVLAADAHYDRPDLDASVMSQWAGLVRDADNLLRELQAAQNGTQSGASGGGGTDTADDTDGSAEDSGPFEETVTVDHDHDPQQAIDDVAGWIQAASGFKKDLQPDLVEFQWGQATVPDNWETPYAGQTVVGVKIEHGGPWKTDGWDNSENEWTDDEIEADFRGSQAAMRDVMKAEDAVIYFGDPDYFNFLPAEEIEAVT